jgi:hypothetical protein
MLFLSVFQKSWGLNILWSGLATGFIVMIITFIAFYFTEETYHKDLNFEEVTEVIP